MGIDRAGLPFIAVALVPAILVSAFWGIGAGAPFWAAAVLLAGFFRDPHRAVPAVPGAVIAPADGKVMVAGDPEPGVAPPGEWIQFSIFLSPFDVHVNRVPVSGRITRIDYRPGRYVPAYSPHASIENERNEIWIERDGQAVVCRQIAGVLVRRVVCRLEPGMAVQAGDRFGIMKFGSRVDVFLPRGTALLVGIGSRVRGGETIVARI